MFPSRGHHESVKSGRPFVVRSFYVGENNGESFDVTAPLITYSRPNGTAPHGRDLLLDFYVSGVPGLVDDVEGDSGYTARVTVDGEAHTLSSWAPYAITGLTPGEHEIRLQLIAPNGEQAPGPFNNTVRTIRIEASQP